MALINAILKWSEEKLHMWQRDALRRLFQKTQGLNNKDYEELLVLIKMEINHTNQNKLKPVKWTDLSRQLFS